MRRGYYTKTKTRVARFWINAGEYFCNFYEMKFLAGFFCIANILVLMVCCFSSLREGFFFLYCKHFGVDGMLFFFSEGRLFLFVRFRVHRASISLEAGSPAPSEETPTLPCMTLTVCTWRIPARQLLPLTVGKPQDNVQAVLHVLALTLVSL